MHKSDTVYYQPSVNVVEMIAKSITTDVTPSIRAWIKLSLAETMTKLFGTIARCESAHVDMDTKFALTNLGAFTGDMRFALNERIPVMQNDCMDFFDLLTTDLYTQANKAIRLGGKWGYFNTDDQELNMIITIRKRVPNRPEWVKATMG